MNILIEWEIVTEDIEEKDGIVENTFTLKSAIELELGYTKNVKYNDRPPLGWAIEIKEAIESWDLQFYSQTSKKWLGGKKTGTNEWSILLMTMFVLPWQVILWKWYNGFGTSQSKICRVEILIWNRIFLFIAVLIKEPSFKQKRKKSKNIWW